MPYTPRPYRKESTRMAIVIFTLLGLGILFVLLAACGQRQEISDGGHTVAIDLSYTPPYDRAVYEVRGTVIGDVDSLTRQTTTGSSEISGYNGYLSGSGSYFSETTGKGFVRLQVVTITANLTPNQLALYGRPGDVIILKTTDAKAQVLQVGDGVHFKCRSDYEPLGAVVNLEEVNAENAPARATWELDLCRMETPVIRPQE